MSSHTTRVHRDRVLADQDALSRLRLRLARVRCAKDESQAQLVDIHRAVEALASEARELEAAEQALTKSLTNTRAVLLREYVMRLPEDVWRCIFEQAVRQDGSRVAFVLGRVSARWRRIALTTPRLWTIIIFPVLEVASAKQLTAAKLMVSRSGVCPLDIKIWWFEDWHYKDELLATMRSVLSALSGQVHRWGTVRLILPGRIRRDALAVLKGPTPKLALLSVSVRSKEWASDVESGYLPHAPMLKSLALEDAAMACSGLATYPALTTTKITNLSSATSYSLVFDIISRATGSLERIEVTAWLDRSGRTSGPLLLPHLETLVLLQPLRSDEARVTPAVSLLSTPRLTHLSLCWDSIPAVPVSFLEAVSSTVRRLTLRNALNADSLERLRHLKNVERVEFGIAIDAAAYATLTTHAPPIWSRLVAVDVRGPSINSSCDALIQFIASRILPCAERGAQSHPAGPCRLREVILTPEAPNWVRSEVQRLLAL